jgi:hypothetical protein
MTQLNLPLTSLSRETQRGAIYEWLYLRGEEGGTDAEIQAALTLPGDTERPRRGELQAMGMIVDSGRKRRTQFNRLATIWIAK